LSSIIRDFLLSSQRQPVISPDNRGSAVYADNASVLITVKNINEFQTKPTTPLDYMKEWFLVNGYLSI
jgi:hypothetical protein